MAKERESQASLLVDRIKRHPLAVIVAFVATLIVSLAALTDSIGQLSQLAHLVGGMSREEAREELRSLGLPYTAESFTESARNGDLRVVRLFITAGMEADASGNNITALMHAAANNDAPLIELLLDAGADVNHADTLGIAAESADAATLRQLLSRSGGDSVDRAFAYAASTAPRENLAMLWEKVSDRKKTASLSLLNVAENIGDSCSDERLERIRYQLALGADPNIADDEGYFPLLYVARARCVNAAQLLLEAGANINARCECSGWLAGGWTALLVASDREDSQPIVEQLLKSGADIGARSNDGSTALMLAVEKDNVAVVNLLIGNRIEVNASDADGVTALMNASGRGLDDIVRLLIDAGADVNARSRRGYTALMRAARDGDAASIRYLVDSKAALDPHNDAGQTALILAANRPGFEVDMLRYLLDRGAAIDHRDNEGYTALMLAAQRANVAAVELLLLRGAQPALKDRAGRTAADLVATSLASDEQRNDREKILFLLKQKRAGSKSRP